MPLLSLSAESEENAASANENVSEDDSAESESEPEASENNENVQSSSDTDLMEEGYENFTKNLERKLSLKSKSKRSRVKNNVNTIPKDTFEGQEFISDSQTALECSIPHDELLNHVKNWDVVFRDYHKNSPDGENGLLRCRGVIKGLIDELMKNSENLPIALYPILKDFARSRTLLRLGHIREQLRNDQSARSKNLLNHWQE